MRLRTMTISIAATLEDAPGLELAAAAFSIGRDIASSVAAAGFVPPAVEALADRATVKLHIALREAAGRPQDERWHAAYDALQDFITFYVRYARSAQSVASFVRLTEFLAENRELSLTQSSLEHS